MSPMLMTAAYPVARGPSPGPLGRILRAMPAKRKSAAGTGKCRSAANLPCGTAKQTGRLRQNRPKMRLRNAYNAPPRANHWRSRILRCWMTLPERVKTPTSGPGPGRLETAGRQQHTRCCRASLAAGYWLGKPPCDARAALTWEFPRDENQDPAGEPRHDNRAIDRARLGAGLPRQGGCAALAVGHDGDLRDHAQGYLADAGRTAERQGRSSGLRDRGRGRRSRLRLAALRGKGA